MKKTPLFGADELICSPMSHGTFRLPKVLLDRVDAAAAQDDPSSPNRSSVVRRALIQYLTRQAEAA
jgi:metal-responsive CopG/Arc/MetJ family transcriptional regulator